MRGLGEEGQEWAGKVLAGQPLEWGTVMLAVRHALRLRPWSEGVAGSKRSAYAKLWKPEGDSAPRIPQYVDVLSRSAVRSAARFRTGCHDLRVETGRWRGEAREQRVCLRCTDQWCEWKAVAGWLGDLGAGGKPIDDEMHFLLECEVTSAVRVSHAEQAGFGAGFDWQSMSEVEKCEHIARCLDAVAGAD